MTDQASLAPETSNPARPTPDWVGFEVTGDESAVAKALANAQSKFGRIERTKTSTVKGETKTGQRYEYTFDYAPLDEVQAATHPALNANGFSVLQPWYPCGTQSTELCLILLHEAGRITVRARFLTPQDPQKLASMITYYRRYQYSLLGVSAETDDDGNAAEGNPATIQPRQTQAQASARPSQPRSNGKSPEAQKHVKPFEERPTRAPENEPETPRPEGPAADKETLHALAGETRRLGWTGAQIAESCRRSIGIQPSQLEHQGGQSLAVKWLEELKGIQTPNG